MDDGDDGDDGAGDDDDDVGDDDAGGDGGDEVPQFYIYKLPIVRLSGCYWYMIYDI